MTKPQRLLSLDVFRGLTMAAMVFVENPGGYIPKPASHAAWHQPITPTDWIFPFFLFIVGVCIPLALTRRKESGSDMIKIVLKIIRRTAILFALGYIMYLMYPLQDIMENGWSGIPSKFLEILKYSRIPGVLQRIAIVYMITSFIFLKTNWKTQAWIIVGILVAYFLVLKYVPFPDGDAGVFFEGRRRAFTLCNWIDQKLLGPRQWGDPEGILSTVPAVCTCLIGALTGQWIMKKNEPTLKVVWLFVAGSILMIIGGVWGWWFPIIKDLWTSTYVLYTAGLGIIGLALCYWIVDVLEYKRWTPPFIAYGINCISVYFASHVLDTVIGRYLKVSGPDDTIISVKDWIVNNLFASWLPPSHAGAFYSLAIVLFWLIPLYIMYRKKWIIKV